MLHRCSLRTKPAETHFQVQIDQRDTGPTTQCNQISTGFFCISDNATDRSAHCTAETAPISYSRALLVSSGWEHKEQPLNSPWFHRCHHTESAPRASHRPVTVCSVLICISTWKNRPYTASGTFSTRMFLYSNKILRHGYMFTLKTEFSAMGPVRSVDKPQF